MRRSHRTVMTLTAAVALMVMGPVTIAAQGNADARVDTLVALARSRMAK